jgi:hypothetical protein
MEDDLKLGLHIIVVLCLIVIAMSAYNVSYGPSYMTDDGSSGANLRFAATTSGSNGPQGSGFMGSGQLEAPVFWNMGSVEQTDQELQAAARDKRSADASSKSKFQGEHSYMTGVESVPKYSDLQLSKLASGSVY